MARRLLKTNDAGEFNIGYTGCRDSVPSLQRIAVYSGEELERLESALA